MSKLKLEIEIDTENDAFQGGFELKEVERILGIYMMKCQDERKLHNRKLLDCNGNTVGQAKVRG